MDFRQALEQGDVALLRKIWGHAFPHLPQPGNDAQAEIVLHRARTQAASITFRKRAYSHAWLLERGYPSGLPDGLRPKAQRIYPITVGAVGIAVKGSTELGRQIAPLIQEAMSKAVLDAYANGDTDPAIVKPLMQQARQNTIRQLIGNR